MALFSGLGNYKNFGLLVMRAGIGVMMMIHGLPKITGGPAKWEALGHAMGHFHIYFAPTFWGFMCAITEAIGGLFCILGLWFRLVCLLMVINFIVASVSMLDAGHGIMGSSETIELFFVFFGLTFLGAGTMSVDKS
jgi:putative oxidoreductase